VDGRQSYRAFPCASWEDDCLDELNVGNIPRTFHRLDVGAEFRLVGSRGLGVTLVVGPN